MRSEGQLPLFGDAADEPAARPPLSDAEARAFAIDPRRNVVLEASAGTGKTTVLVTRYLNLLGAGVDPSRILAITFTRQAAAEMRERIIGGLRAAAERSPRDRARWVDLRDRLGEIAISTVDAFCLALLRQFPLEADLDPGFGMADETEMPRLVEQAVGRALAVCGRLAREDAAVRMVLATLGPRRCREALSQLLHHRLVADRTLGAFLASVPRLDAELVCRDAVARLAGALAPDLLRQLVEHGPTDDPPFRRLAQELRSIDRLAETPPAAVRVAIDRVREHFMTLKGTPRRAFAYPGGSASRGRQKRYREAALALAPRVTDAIRAFDRDVNVVLARGAQRMFAIATAEYQRELDAQALVDFSGVLERAVALLRQMDEFSRSRYRLESRYLHVLVDEFQDTSRAQWELVSLLVESWREGLGIAHDEGVPPSIFIVGDRKQSIYRFRDAEVAMLGDAGDFIETLRPHDQVRRSISHSFRAVPELLAFVNDVFDEVEKAPARRDAFRYGDADRFPVEARRPWRQPLGIVAADDLETCAAAIAEEVGRLLAEESVRDRDTGVPRAVRPRDIVVLFRSREAHREIEKALERRGLPTSVYKGLGFFDADEIKDFRAVMRFLANPWSDLRAAAFLRSRLVRLSDRGLSQLAARGLSRAVLDSELPPTIGALHEDDGRVLVKVRSSVRRWLALVDRMPPAELTDLVLAESAYAAELAGAHTAQARENLKKMRALVRRLQNRGYVTLARVADHVDHLSGDVSNAIVDAFDAVNLMTIHAAKGLEFPVVFLANMTRGTAGRRPPIHVVPDQGDGRPSVAVWPFRSEAEADERARDREETKRLLYVAMTRARDRLYLSGVLNGGEFKAGRGSLGEVLPASFGPVFAEAASALADGTQMMWRSRGGRAHALRACRPFPAREPAPIEAPGAPSQDRFGPLAFTADVARVPVTSFVASDARSWANEMSVSDESDALVGRVVHRALQRSRGGRDADEIRRLACEILAVQGEAAPTDLEAVVDRAMAACNKLQGDPDVRALLAGECLFEVPFSMVVDRTGFQVAQGAGSGVQGGAPAARVGVGPRPNQEMTRGAAARGDSLEPPPSAHARGGSLWGWGPASSEECTPRALNNAGGGGSGVIVRGAIDCIARSDDGRRVAVLEFKTGRPQPDHERQLDLYVRAARTWFPSAAVTGSLIYV